MGVVGKLNRKFEPKRYEEEILEFWRKEGIYEQLRERPRKAKFYFLDGPPYPSSETPHIGTIWNKVIKDVIIRYRRSRGFKVTDRPGYDCHGLPIEVAVEKLLGFKSKRDIEEYGIGKFVERCKELALTNLSRMSEHFENLGVSMDWRHPYLTLDRGYIESAWWLIKKVWEEGLLERGLKVVHWCPRCETVLADYEVTEYRVLEDPSIYVKFPLVEQKGTYILIWTTTPWTLPANVSVMVHPDFDYAFVKYKGEVLIVAKGRLKEVFRELGNRYEVLKVVKGRELEGLKYVPPLLEEVPIQSKLKNAHRVVLSEEYVNLLEGTGCVHMAPGHGEEDFEVAMKYKLPVLMPVDSRGVFTEEGGKYKGLYVREANEVIIRDLERKGLLLHRDIIRHRYPVCWRCKTPLILRATEQWIIRVTKLKDRILKEASKVNWIPPWAGLHRFKNWLEGLRDWIISRQRYWGTPLPIWVCARCGNVKVVGSTKELEALIGRKLELRDLHRPWIDEVKLKCEKCGNVMKRVEDVLDVWFDSGIAFYASLGYPFKKEEFEKLWPVDFIVEGHDQIAGWFFSLLKVGVLGFGKAPYRTVLMHGFTLDEKGRPMHKSLGNFISPADVLKFERGSRDVLRLYLLQNIPWEDLRFSWEGVKQAFNDLNIIWNVYVFASTYMNLDRFDPCKWDISKLKGHLRQEDLWILSKVESLTYEVTNLMDKYLIHLAVRKLREFIINDISHWYIKLIRRRVWVEEEDPSKITAYIVLYRVLEKFLRLVAPIIPFTAEKMFIEVIKPVYNGRYESIHLMPWPEIEREFINKELEEDMEAVRELVELAYSVRMKAGIKIRQPLPKAVIITDDNSLIRAINRFKEVFLSQVNVKGLEFTNLLGSGKYLTIEIKAKEGKLKELEGKLVKSLQLSEVLKLIRGEEVKRRIGGTEVNLTRNEISVKLRVKENYVLGLGKRALLLLSVRIGARERGEGLAKDVIRRIQYMRKCMDLPVDAYIYVRIYTPAEEKIRLLAPFKDYVAEETRAKTIELVKSAEAVVGEEVRKWVIDGVKFIIGITREGNG